MRKKTLIAVSLGVSLLFGNVSPPRAEAAILVKDTANIAQAVLTATRTLDILTEEQKKYLLMIQNMKNFSIGQILQYTFDNMDGIFGKGTREALGDIFGSDNYILFDVVLSSDGIGLQGLEDIFKNGIDNMSAPEVLRELQNSGLFDELWSKRIGNIADVFGSKRYENILLKDPMAQAEMKKREAAYKKQIEKIFRKRIENEQISKNNSEILQKEPEGTNQAIQQNTAVNANNGLIAKNEADAIMDLVQLETEKQAEKNRQEAQALVEGTYQKNLGKALIQAAMPSTKTTTTSGSGSNYSIPGDMLRTESGGFTN